MKITKELKIGIFVIFVLTASFFVINFLRGKDIFGKEIDVVSFYENVEGLLPSAPVYIKGYKAGAVSDVVYRPETGEFEVICSVLKEFVIPEDSRIIIYWEAKEYASILVHRKRLAVTAEDSKEDRSRIS